MNYRRVLVPYGGREGIDDVNVIINQNDIVIDILNKTPNVPISLVVGKKITYAYCYKVTLTVDSNPEYYL